MSKWAVAKLGGSNMKTAQDVVSSIDTLIKLSKDHPDTNYIFVFSAFFNLTNELEVLVNLYEYRDPAWSKKLEECLQKLNGFVKDLSTLKCASPAEIESINVKWSTERQKFQKLFENNPEPVDGKFRDLILSHGELLSLFIISLFLPLFNISFKHVDPRQFIKTDDNFGNAEILSDQTKKLIAEKFETENSTGGRIFITAGFIGSTINGSTTTVGREGSDYIAAVLARLLPADTLYFYKDVGAIFDSMENRKRLVKMSYDDLRQKISKEKFKAMHPKVINCLDGQNIVVFIAHPRTGEIGTTISPT